MSTGRPLWRRGFDFGERIVGRRLEELVATRTFSDAIVLALRGQSAAYRLFERQTRAVLHFWNVPSRSDVRKLSRQLGAMGAELRELAAKLEEQQQLPQEQEERPQNRRSRLRRADGGGTSASVRARAEK